MLETIRLFNKKNKREAEIYENRYSPDREPIVSLVANLKTLVLSGYTEPKKESFSLDPNTHTGEAIRTGRGPLGMRRVAARISISFFFYEIRLYQALEKERFLFTLTVASPGGMFRSISEIPEHSNKDFEAIIKAEPDGIKRSREEIDQARQRLLEQLNRLFLVH